jgi:hypothetical protein
VSIDIVKPAASYVAFTSLAHTVASEITCGSTSRAMRSPVSRSTRKASVVGGSVEVSRPRMNAHPVSWRTVPRHWTRIRAALIPVS